MRCKLAFGNSGSSSRVCMLEDGDTRARTRRGCPIHGNGQASGRSPVRYVTSEEDSHVAVIDVTALKVLKTIGVGPRPRSTAFLPDSTRAYVSSENGSSVAVIDSMKHEVLDTIKLTGQLVRPMGVVAAPDGKHIFVTTGRGKGVVIIETATNKPIASVEVGPRTAHVRTMCRSSMSRRAP